MIAVFIYELVVNAQAQGSPFSFHVSQTSCSSLARFSTPIQIQPVVNPMLGPSGSALIRVGARFPPCMKNVSQVPPTLNLPCELVLIFVYAAYVKHFSSARSQ
jgi:hypothetical protein